ncbi:MAG: hypothetical protein HYZ24_10340 [Chloroflexi bacterium]|nr:hypothetical protein [Chloroflexota bacterium]
MAAVALAPCATLRLPGAVEAQASTHDHVVVLLAQVIMSFFTQLPPLVQFAPHPSSFSQLQ